MHTSRRIDCALIALDTKTRLLCPTPQGWPGGWEAWAKQEPENAHSHLLSLMLGNSETVPIKDGELMTGVWQVCWVQTELGRFADCFWMEACVEIELAY